MSDIEEPAVRESDMQDSLAADVELPPTPGAVLRKAREGQGLSVSDVAQVIRFSVRQVEALEADDYASLPGATAVRGFVRSYAKLLKLDATPLLADLAPSVPPPAADVRPPTNMGEAEQPSMIEQVSPRIIVAGFALLITALAVFWVATKPDETEGNAVVSVPAPQTITPLPAAPAQATVVPAVPTETPAATATLAPAASTTAPVATVASPAAVAVPAAASGLRVEFDGLSWIEVRDAQQRVVYVGEYPAGTKQDVVGKAPFQIWIGKASGVRVSMNGRAVDLKPHTREEVARLTVE